MALVKCGECGEEISNKAESCPKCGFKPKRPRKTSFGTWVGTFLIIGGLIYYFNLPSRPPYVDTRTPEQVQQDKERMDAIKAVAVAGNRFKKNLKNPKSFEIVEYKYKKTKDGFSFYILYSATNSFNAVIQEEVLLDTDEKGELLKITPLQ